MTVLINRWLGDRFEKRYASCDICKKPGTVKQIMVLGSEYPKDDEDLRICKPCLLAMVAEIDAAVLGAATGGENGS